MSGTAKLGNHFSAAINVTKDRKVYLSLLEGQNRLNICFLKKKTRSRV